MLELQKINNFVDSVAILFLKRKEWDIKEMGLEHM